MNCIRLPLKYVKNARDLGGYCTKDNKITKFKTFVRSSRLTDLTKEDNEFLKKYGITDIIDLRGVTKIQATFVSDDNIDGDYFKFYYLPLSNKESEDYSKAHELEPNFDFGEAYKFMLNNKEKVKQIFTVFAEAKGGVLFHCTAGKDRTGTVAALLLGLCGVDDLDIIANYQVTETYISGSAFLDTYAENVQKSDAKYIRTLIMRLKETYGTYENYLLSCGLSQETLNKIKDKFLEDFVV